MSFMKIQIDLKPNKYHRLKKEADRKSISLSELVQKLVNEHLKRNRVLEEEPYVVGLGRSGKLDVSKRHDHYLKEIMRKGGKK